MTHFPVKGNRAFYDSGAVFVNDSREATCRLSFPPQRRWWSCGKFHHFPPKNEFMRARGWNELPRVLRSLLHPKIRMNRAVVCQFPTSWGRRCRTLPDPTTEGLQSGSDVAEVKFEIRVFPRVPCCGKWWRVPFSCVFRFYYYLGKSENSRPWWMRVWAVRRKIVFIFFLRFS